MLRNDRKRRTDDIDNSLVDVDEVTDLPGEVPLDQSPPNASNGMSSGSNLEITGPRTNSQQNASEIVESSDDTGDSEIPSQQKCNDAAQIVLQRLMKKRDATAAGLQSTSINPTAKPPLSSSWRSSYDNTVQRQLLEEEKWKETVSYLREQIASGKATHETLYLKLNFPSCYDIEFLKSLAEEFKADISHATSKKRPAHKEVLTEFISKII